MNSNENDCPNLPSTHTTRSTHLGWLVSLPWGSKAPLCSAAVFTGPQSRARIPVSEPSPVLPAPPFIIPPPPVSHSSTMTPPSTPLQHLFSRTSTLVRSPQQVYERKFQDQVCLPTSHLSGLSRGSCLAVSLPCAAIVFYLLSVPRHQQCVYHWSSYLGSRG